MAVYTEVNEKMLKHFLSINYDIGKLQSHAGIDEGIENTNYHIRTNQGRFILTIFEKRTPVQDLQFFMSLMDHLADRGFSCPQPVKARDDSPLQELEGKKAAIVTFVSGRPIMAPSNDNCWACGEIMARLHQAAADFIEPRPNPLGMDGCVEIFEKIRGGVDKEWPGLVIKIEAEISVLKKTETTNTPAGIIHADLFPDNVHFEKKKVCGVIDFYFACMDLLAYDIAVTANSWCFDEKGVFQAGKFLALVEGYESIRQLGRNEKNALPLLMRRAALRFLLTRAQDWLFPPKGIMGVTKDPMEYMKILSFHRRRRHISDYLELGKQA